MNTQPNDLSALDMLRAVNRVAATLRALARDEDRPEPMTASYARWLALRLYTLADELDAQVQAHLPAIVVEVPHGE